MKSKIHPAWFVTLGLLATVVVLTAISEISASIPATIQPTKSTPTAAKPDAKVKVPFSRPVDDVDFGDPVTDSTLEAAKAGDAEAEFRVFMSLADENGNLPDDRQAFQWCFRATAHGLARAEAYLAYFYLDGVYVSKSVQVYRDLMMDAFSQGREKAGLIMAEHLASGDLGEYNPRFAMTILLVIQKRGGSIDQGLFTRYSNLLSKGQLIEAEEAANEWTNLKREPGQSPYLDRAVLLVPEGAALRELRSVAQFTMPTWALTAEQLTEVRSIYADWSAAADFYLKRCQTEGSPHTQYFQLDAAMKHCNACADAAFQEESKLKTLPYVGDRIESLARSMRTTCLTRTWIIEDLLKHKLPTDAIADAIEIERDTQEAITAFRKELRQPPR